MMTTVLLWLSILAVWTPQSLAQDLCDGCKLVNGAGFNPHPTDCTQYVHCVLGVDGKSVGLVRSCGPDLFWDQDALICNRPENAHCVNDKCQEGNVSAYTFPGHCGDYWTCVGRRAQRQECPPGMAVSPSFVCVPSDSCGAATTTSNTVPEGEVNVVCKKKTVPDKAGFYLEEVEGYGWMERPCAPETAFSHKHCGCISDSSTPPSRQQACSPELYLPFTNDVTDASGRWTWVQNDGVTVTGGVAIFDGSGVLRVFRFTNYEFGQDFVVRFRYLEQGSSSSQPQALVTNGDCGEGSTFYVIRTSPHVLTFGYVNALKEKTSVTVSALPDEDPNDDKTFSELLGYERTGWRTVEFRFSKGVLTGTVDGKSQTATGTGRIARNQCALQIGGGYGYSNFSGQMDKIRVYTCAPGDKEFLSSDDSNLPS